jgi:hypothetical protein
LGLRSAIDVNQADAGVGDDGAGRIDDRTSDRAGFRLCACERNKTSEHANDQEYGFAAGHLWGSHIPPR